MFPTIVYTSREGTLFMKKSYNTEDKKIGEFYDRTHIRPAEEIAR